MPLINQPSQRPRPTESAIIVAVPEAESVVARHRDRFDGAAARGVPAHVTILYPFIAPADITDAVVARVRDVTCGIDSFTCRFRHTARFDDDVLWLAPEPADAFRSMTAAVVDAFPAYLPYGGAFGADITPHLTVAESRLAGRPEEIDDVERQVQPMLPFEAKVSEALLIAGTSSANSWGVLARLPLGAW